MAELTSAYVCQEASIRFFCKKKNPCLLPMLWKTQHCSKCHFTSALCSVSRLSLQYNNYAAKKKMQESVCRACNLKYRVLVNEDEMKSSVYMMALILRFRGIIRVDPCHHLAYKILHLGCVKFIFR